MDLKECADIIADTDNRMLKIRKIIESNIAENNANDDDV